LSSLVASLLPLPVVLDSCVEEYDEYGDVIPDDGSDDYDYLDVVVPRPVLDPPGSPVWSVRVPRFAARFRDVQSDFRLLEPVMQLLLHLHYDECMALPLPADAERRPIDKVTKDPTARLAELRALQSQFGDGPFVRSD
jgi:hypothetical protein